jgi:hypothetical protein
MNTPILKWVYFLCFWVHYLIEPRSLFEYLVARENAAGVSSQIGKE